MGSVTITGNTGAAAGGVHYALGSLTWEGKPVITENKTAAGETVNFLYEAQRGSVMKIEDLAADAKIGVTLFTGVESIAATGATPETAACFVGDDGTTYETTDKGYAPSGSAAVEDTTAPAGESEPKQEQDKTEDTKAPQKNPQDNKKPTANDSKGEASFSIPPVAWVIALAVILSVAIVIVIFKM